MHGSSWRWLAGLVASGAFVWLACGGGGDGTGPTPTPTTGTVRATVTADGGAKSGVSVDLFSSGGTSALQTQTTASNGDAVFTNVAPGGYDVVVTVPSGFQLGTGEVARKAVTAAAGATASVGFALRAETPQTTVEISASNLAFSNPNATIARGTRVRWRNGDGVFHTVTPDGHSEWSAASLGANQTFEHTFNTAGTFLYYCEPHRGQGMTGRIVVQ